MGSSDLNRYLGFLQTPSLWVKEQFGLEQFDFPALDTNQLSIAQIPGGLRLGHQMEFIFLECIEQSGYYSVLAHNIPVRKGGHTLGEIDFLLEDLVQHQVLHVELTYKFYIINPEISESIHRLMGPNKRDMFFTKLDKIKEEQLALLDTPQGAVLMDKFGLQGRAIYTRVCFKAQLFHPYGQAKIHIRPLNKACIAGYWVRFDIFNSQAFRSGQYYLPYKHEWVIFPNNKALWTTYYEVLLEINIRMIKKQSPLVWRRISDTEYEKFFVVWW